MKRVDANNLCLGCGAKLPPAFLDLGRTPLANSYVQPECAGQPESTFRLALAYCPACYLVQLIERISPAQLFNEYLYFSSYSDSFVQHARTMAASLAERFS